MTSFNTVLKENTTKSNIIPIAFNFSILSQEHRTPVLDYFIDDNYIALYLDADKYNISLTGDSNSIEHELFTNSFTFFDKNTKKQQVTMSFDYTDYNLLLAFYRVLNSLDAVNQSLGVVDYHYGINRSFAVSSITINGGLYRTIECEKDINNEEVCTELRVMPNGFTIQGFYVGSVLY